MHVDDVNNDSVDDFEIDPAASAVPTDDSADVPAPSDDAACVSAGDFEIDPAASAAPSDDVADVSAAPSADAAAESDGSVDDPAKVYAETAVSAPVGSSSFIFLPTPEPDLVTGKVQIGSNVVTGVLGRGGTATVYKVWNETLEVYRVVKLLSPDAETERFQTEAKIIAKLGHENIVEVYTFDNWNGRFYMEMAFVDGSDLQKIIAEHEKLPDVVCTAIAIFVARALAHAHGQTFTLKDKQYNGVIHRDIKPANILISKNGAVKLTDFGIARPLEASLYTTDNENISGTLHYLSPEQMQGGEIDCRSDIYSFGMILYEMLCGERTFPQTAIPEVVAQKAINKFKSFAEHGVDVNPELERIVLRCLSLDPADRYQTTADLVNDLQNFYATITTMEPKSLLKQYFGLPGDTTIMDMNITGANPALKEPKTSLGPLTASMMLERKNKRGWPVILAVLVLAGVASYFVVRARAPHLLAFASGNLASSASMTEAMSAASDTTSAAGDTLPSAPKDTARTVKESAPVKTDRASVQAAEKKKEAAQPPARSPAQDHDDADEAQLMREAMAAANAKQWNKVIDILEQESAFKTLAGQRTLQLFNAYVESFRFSKAQAIMDTTSLTQDAYFLMCAGKYWRYKGAPDMAIKFFEAAITSSSIVVTRNLLPHGALFYIAELRQERYNANPSPANKAVALAAWKKVAAALETKPDNPMKKVSDHQISVLSD